ncbi:MAG: hypothetical protein FJ087_16650, partial [Deltaproteobacteria bacterium]|nr:hypothetical protein [Deltaproteobacteria bacterium]
MKKLPFAILTTIAAVSLAACGGRDSGGTPSDDTIETPDGTTSDNKDVKPDTKPPDVLIPDGMGDVEIPTDHPIVQAQMSKDSTDCTASSIANFATGLTGTAIVVSPKFVAYKDKTTGQPKLDGYFLAVPDLAGALPYTGIQATLDSALGTDYKPGEKIQFTGEHTEYYCMTQLGLDSTESVGTGSVPAPLTIDPCELGDQDAKAEPLEGVLVRIADVTVEKASVPGSDGKDHGMFAVDCNLIVGPLFWPPYMSSATDSRTVGDKFDEIVGVVQYSYGQYVLHPRGESDMLLHGATPVEPKPDQQPVEVVPDVPKEGVEPDVQPEVPPTDVPVTDTGIAAIQESADSKTCGDTGKSVTFGTGIEFKGAVVTSPKFSASASLDGYFVADQGPSAAAWHGIQVVFPTSLATDFGPGDVIDFTGDHLEYYCYTEIKGSAATAAGTAYVPQALDIDPCDLGEQDAAKAEALEGVLVRVKDVTVENANPDDPKDYGSFVVDCGLIVSNTFKLPYMSKDSGERTVGDEFDEIVGVVAYNFGKFVLLPRSEADMVKAGTVTPEPSPEVIENDAGTDVPVTPAGAIAEIQKAGDSTTCASPDKSVTISENVSFDAVVTSPRFDASYTLHGFYVADEAATAQQWGGFLVVGLKTLGMEVAVGDMVSVTGKYDEYYCMSELSATGFQKKGTTTAPEPLEIDPCDLGGQDPLKAEPLEGVLVRVTAVEVTNANPDGPDKDYGSFLVDCDI